MKTHHTGTALAALAGLALLGACGQGSEPAATPEAATETVEIVLANGMTPKAQIELRQGQLKQYGKAFKAMSDQLKSGEPDLAAIQEAATSLQAASVGMETWFPEGTGPETGIKTDALPAIWETPDDFSDEVANFHAAVGELVLVTEGGDVDAIRTAFGTAGGTCKSCHDNYRQDD